MRKRSIHNFTIHKAHQDKVNERNEDYARINEEMEMFGFTYEDHGKTN